MKKTATGIGGHTFRGFTLFAMFTVGNLVAVGCTGSVQGSGSKGGDKAGRVGGRNNGGTGGTQDTVVTDPETGFTFELPTYECDQSAVSPSVGLRKLSTAQYRNTVHDLIGFALKGDTDKTLSVWNAIAADVDRFPTDGRAQLHDVPGNRQMNQALQQGHVEEAYTVALSVAGQLTNSQRLGWVAGACATDNNTGNDNQCITDFINSFGERALRRPLTDKEVTFYRKFYGDDSASAPLAWADLIAGFMTAPQFLYFVEHGEDAVGGKPDVYDLSPHELASRLSYHFLQTMPDDALWAAAKSGALVDEAEYTRQVDRLMGLADARRSTQEFFEDYLRVADVDEVDKNKNDDQFKLFAADTIPSSRLRQAMIDDVVDMTEWYTWNKDNGTMRDLLLSEHAFARSMELADLYGTTVWDGESEPPLFPGEQERHGIFTRAAFMATGLVKTRPIIKGAHLRMSWLCDDIPPPPDGAENEPFDDVRLTSRESVERLTEQAGSSCKGCHGALMNPLGFATEHFDAIGRFRTDEMLFDENLAHVGMAPINASAVPQVHLGDPRVVNDAGGLMELIASSGKVEACIARHYFRYTFAREENDALDGCVLEDLRRAISGKGTLRDFIRAAALVPEFKQRQIMM